MPRNEDRELRLRWSRRLSLRQRILAVNIFAIIILAGSLFYLDGFRTRLTQDELEQSRGEAVMIAHALAAASPGGRERHCQRLAHLPERLADEDGQVDVDVQAHVAIARR